MNKLIAVAVLSSLAVGGYLVAGDGECSKAAAGACAKEQVEAKGACSGEAQTAAAQGTCPMQAKGACSATGTAVQADAAVAKAAVAKKTVKPAKAAAKAAKPGDQASAK